MNHESPEEAIKKTILDLAKAQDTRDAAGYRACFADQVMIDQPNHPGWKRSVVSADEWTKTAMGHLRAFDETQHSVSDFRITVKGRRALCFATSRALHILVEDGVATRWEAIGTFTLRLELVHRRWLIVERALRVERELGDLQMKFRIHARVTAAGAAETPAAAVKPDSV